MVIYATQEEVREYKSKIIKGEEVNCGTTVTEVMR